MRLLINTASTLKGGGIQVAKSFIEECKNFSNHQYFVVLSKPLSTIIDIHSFPENFSFFTAPLGQHAFLHISLITDFLKKEKVFKPNVVFTTSGPSYWKPSAPHLMGYNIPHYIYPESPYFKMIPLKRKLWWRAMKLFAYFNFKYNADAYVVQTDDVRNRLQKFINKDNVFTIFNTINSHYVEYKKYPNKLMDRSNLEFRLLTLTAWYPHKNLEIISEVIEVLRKTGETTIKFVLTINQTDFEKSSLVNYPEVENIGSVNIEEAPSLYAECDAMFLPTLLECFSASYVEAMQMRKPILTSNMGFAHTICENAALYFNPTNPEDIATKIIALKDSLAMQQDLVKKGTERLKIFGTPFERAKKYLEICESLIK